MISNFHEKIRILIESCMYCTSNFSCMYEYTLYTVIEAQNTGISCIQDYNPSTVLVFNVLELLKQLMAFLR